MTDERLNALEVRVANIQAENAGLKVSVDHLADAVVDLSKVVQEFRDTLNKGKGAVWLFGVLAAAIGGFISWLMPRLFHP